MIGGVFRSKKQTPMSLTRLLISRIKSTSTPLMSLLLTSLLLSLWFKIKIESPQTSGAYFATGESTIGGYAAYLGLWGVVQTVFFIIFAATLFLFFKKGLGIFLSFVCVLVVMTSAQVILVYLSAPLWDFSTGCLTLATVAGTVGLLSRGKDQISVARPYQSATACVIIITNLLVIAVSYRTVFSFSKRFGTTLVGIMLIVYGLLIIIQKRNSFSNFYSRITNVVLSDKLIFIPVITTITLLSPMLGRGKASASSFVVLLCFVFLLISTKDINLSSKVILTIGYLAVIKMLNPGAAPYGWYTFQGWQSAPQLLSGVTGSPISYGLPYVDGPVWLASESNSINHFGMFLNGILLNSPIHLEYMRIGWTFLSEGIWRYSEAPIGFESNIFFRIRHIVLSPVRFVSSPLLLLSLFILWRRNRKITLFVISLLFLLMLLFGISRPGMHQWWFLSLFGVWGVIYATKEIVGTLKKFYTTRDVFGSWGELLKPLSSALRVDGWKSKQRLRIGRYLLLSVAPSLIFIVMEAVTPQIQKVQISGLVKAYESQNWASVTSDELSPYYIIDSATNLLKISTSKNCNLSGLRVRYPNLDSDGNQHTEYYSTKFYVNSTKANVAFLPYFASSMPLSKISVSGVNTACQLRINQAHLKVGSSLLVGLLSTRQSTVFAAKTINNENRDSKLDAFEILESSIKFNGYLPTGGYQAVGREREPSWKNKQISDRIVGRTMQGYQSIDVWRQSLKIESGMTRVRLKGEVSRGVVMFGWASDAKNFGEVSEPEFDYQIFGSIFGVSKRRIDLCLKIGNQKELREQVKIDLFVSSLIDLYSPSWTNFKVDSVIVDGGKCEDSKSHQGFLPTL